jgi:alpha-tubulin suppressor-like RCC1 family protein
VAIATRANALLMLSSFVLLTVGCDDDSTAPPTSTITFAELSAGGQNTCGVVVGGAAYCWGFNEYGQLGNGTTTDGTNPTVVGGGLTFGTVGVVVGGEHRCGVTNAGAAYCWGYHGYGQLGIGTQTGPTTCPGPGIRPCSTTPVAVVGGLTFAALASGIAHTCGVTPGGAAYCWGLNFNGQLGIGTTNGPELCAEGSNPCSTSPVAVIGGLTFAMVSAGASHTCAVTAAGAAYCWGANTSGQLGDSTTAQRTSPVAVAEGLTFTSVSAGFGYTCGVTLSGAAYCWGLNNSGQLGIGSASGPQQCGVNPCSTAPVPVVGGLTFKKLSVSGDQSGFGHACGVAVTGVVYCWGTNLGGQLGDGTKNSRPTPAPVSGGFTFASVSAGSNNYFGQADGQEHTCGVTTTGIAHCWGANAYGQLGDGSKSGRTSPVPVSSPSAP